MPKLKWDDADDPYLTISIKLVTASFENALMRIDRNRPQYNIPTLVDCNTTWRQVSYGT